MDFFGYDIEKIEYISNKKNSDDEEQLSIIPEFLFKIAINKDNPNLFNIIMGVRIGYIENKLPFKAEVIIRGYYKITENEYTQKNKEAIMVSNGSAILFPYLRMTLTDITARGRHSSIILPTMNFHTIFQDKSFEDLSFEVQYEDF